MAESDHHAAIEAWLSAVPREPPVTALLDAFERAFAALWRRSHLVLGEVTLTAIVDRVLYTAAEQFPLLAAIDLEPPHLRCHRLRSQVDLGHDDVAAALEVVLVDLMSVLGTLTAEILTPALHAALAEAAAGGGDEPVASAEAAR